MKLAQDIKPVTYMKTHSARLIEEVNEKHRPVIITQNGKAKVVLLDIESYEKQKETLLILKIIAQGESDIKSKKLIEQIKLFSKLEKEFGL
jgi:prevent-host-death family protein